MQSPRRVIIFTALALTLISTGCATRQADRKATATAARGPTVGAAATVHPLATEAALAALSRGGNAVDAAVAAALTLGVVDGHNSGIGGGCFMLVRTADGRVVALDGREQAPAAATRDMFVRDGKADTALSQTGPLAVGIPGSVAVYQQAVRELGRLPLADLIRPAADLAERGFPIDRTYAARLAATADDIAKFPGTRAVLLHADGSPLREGETLRQPDLARTYRQIAGKGAAHFYRGSFATAVDKWMRANGGAVRAADFAAYEMKRREPLVSTYRGRTIIGFPPPSSGGVHVAQILNTLEPFDLQKLDAQDPGLRLHVTLEAMKLAFADRAHYLGDPKFVKVPRGLASPAYGRMLAARVRLDAAGKVDGPGSPPAADTEAFDDLVTGRHTTHVATADAEGNVVALTTTVNTAFGSKVIVPGTGVILNNQMDDFSAEPGVPNAFGLVGSEANAVAPGKRPLSSMSPTIVLDAAQRPILTLGAAGGPKIISQAVLTISHVVDLNDALVAAVARPRVHHQWRPDGVWAERNLNPAVVARLQALGHRVQLSEPGGATQAIGIDPSTTPPTFTPISDPRVQGAAAVTPATAPAQ